MVGEAGVLKSIRMESGFRYNLWSLKSILYLI